MHRNENRSVYNSRLVILEIFRGSSWLSKLSPHFQAWKRRSVVIWLLSLSPAPAHTTACTLCSSDFSDRAASHVSRLWHCLGLEYSFYPAHPRPLWLRNLYSFSMTQFFLPGSFPRGARWACKAIGSWVEEVLMMTHLSGLGLTQPGHVTLGKLLHGAAPRSPHFQSRVRKRISTS